MLETRHRFREDLKGLERQALGGMDMVVQSLDRALQAISHQDAELATAVIADDDRIEGCYLEVHQGILSMLALQAPVATDLRILATLLDMIRCIERMGDQCVNIAKLAVLCGPQPAKDEVILDAVERMGHLTRSQVSQAKDAFAGRNVALAGELRRNDITMSRLNREIFNRAVEIGEDLGTREWAMCVVLVARALERIADNATEIAEQTGFVETGLLPLFDAPRAH